MEERKKDRKVLIIQLLLLLVIVACFVYIVVNIEHIKNTDVCTLCKELGYNCIMLK